MSSDDEIWSEESMPPGTMEQYIATLLDVNDQSNLATETIQAASDSEGIVFAIQWAMAECKKIGKKALLIVVGGNIRGSHSEEIEPE